MTIKTPNGPACVPDSRERVILARNLCIADRVMMAVPSTCNGWSKRAVVNGVKGTVIGFTRYTMFQERLSVYRNLPGEYECNGQAIVQWDTGVSDVPSCHDIVLLLAPEGGTRNKENSSAYFKAFDTPRRIRSLPDLPFWELDVVRFKNSARNVWPESKELVVSKVSYHNVGEFCDDGTTPLPIYQVEPSTMDQGRCMVRESDLELVRRGNVWLWEHDRDEVTFASLQEECFFHHQTGRSTEVECPQTGTFAWEEPHILQAALNGIIDAVKISGGLFGCKPQAFAYKFHDPDLSKRANAELVKGFSTNQTESLK